MQATGQLELGGEALQQRGKLGHRRIEARGAGEPVAIDPRAFPVSSPRDERSAMSRD